MSRLEIPDRQRVLRWTVGIITALAALPFFIFGIPVLFALIALRWHLLGGGLVVLAGLTGLIRLVQIGSDQWGGYLFLMLLLIGGGLHIMVGLGDRRRNTVLGG